MSQQEYVLAGNTQSETVEKILLLDDVDDIWKILLLMATFLLTKVIVKKLLRILKADP